MFKFNEREQDLFKNFILRKIFIDLLIISLKK